MGCGAQPLTWTLRRGRSAVLFFFFFFLEGGRFLRPGRRFRHDSGVSEVVVRLAGMLGMLTVRTAGARRFGSASNWAGRGPWAAAEGRGGQAQGPLPCGVPWPPGAAGPQRGVGVGPVRAGSGNAGDNL